MIGDKPSYPGRADLERLLASLGVMDAKSAAFRQIDLDAKLAGSIASWEEETGWQPFLADTEDVTRLFDPPGPHVSRSGATMLTLRGGGRILFLDAGLVSLTSLMVGVLAGAGGSPYQIGTQFFLRPDNAPLRKKPWTRIEFLVPVLAGPQGIAITGRWGYRVTCPASAWQAVLQGAALNCLPELQLMVTGGLVKIADAQFLTSGGQSPFSTAAAQWSRTWDNGVADFYRE